MEWVGSVEIHINASGWTQHKHDSDPAYENVILHVVWKDDRPVKRKDNTLLSSVELKNRVDEQLLLQCHKLVNSPEPIPCAGVLNKVHDLVKISTLDGVLIQRLEKKAQSVLATLQRNNNDWEETCYQLLCRNFGFNVNTEPFLQLAQSLSYKILLKHAGNLLQIEALLFGQAGMLEEEKEDEYYNLLRREYMLLGHKYQLTERKLNKAQWRFLRLRPANFPTIRLAQLASLIHYQKNIFSRMLEEASPKGLKAIFRIQQSDYWRCHYRFFKKVEEDIAGLGEASIENIIINTTVPLLTAYSKSKDEQILLERAVEIMRHIPAESNTITKQWVNLGMNIGSAFDSQALLELHNDLCLRKKCLECKIGASLVKPSQK